MLDVGDGHSLYWELCGNPDGKPVVFLHGGPGGGSSPDHRRQFNPDKYKILVFDQRGCGKSTPYASLDAQHDVGPRRRYREASDRRSPKVDKWQVFGGSWGSTLALAYAETYPERVTELVLRGIFLFDQYEIDWMYKEGGASQVYPDKFEEFLAPIPEAERGDLVEAYRKRLTEQRQGRAARRREGVEQVGGRHRHLAAEPVDDRAFHRARHRRRGRAHREPLYGEPRLARGRPAAARARRSCAGIPGVIVQGRHDTCTPPVAAWKLKQAWPEVELNIIPDGGHLFSEPGVLDGLVRATDKFAGALVTRPGGRSARCGP